VDPPVKASIAAVESAYNLIPARLDLRSSRMSQGEKNGSAEK
jgi:hypothetical protein